MSSVVKSVGKVFKKAVKVIKKVAPYIILIAAVVFTAGAAMAAAPAMFGAAGAAAAGGTGVFGWSAALASSSLAQGAFGGIIAGAIKGAVIGTAIGGLTAAATGGDIWKGMKKGAIGGAIAGGFSGGLQHGVGGVPAPIPSSGTVAGSLPHDPSVASGTEAAALPRAVPLRVRGPGVTPKPIDLGAVNPPNGPPLSFAMDGTPVAVDAATQQGVAAAGNNMINPSNLSVGDSTIGMVRRGAQSGTPTNALGQLGETLRDLSNNEVASGFVQGATSAMLDNDDGGLAAQQAADEAEGQRRQAEINSHDGVGGFIQPGSYVTNTAHNGVVTSSGAGRTRYKWNNQRRQLEEVQNA